MRAVRDTSATFRPLTTGAFVRRELGFFRAHPADYASDYVREFVHFFQPMPDRVATPSPYNRPGVKAVGAVYFLPTLLLALLGLWNRRATWRDRLLLLLLPFSTAAVYALFFTQTRYRIPVEPQLIVLAALGVARLVPRAVETLAGGPDAAARRAA